MATSAKKLIVSISSLFLSLVTNAQEYRVSIDMRGKEITGICAISQQNEGNIIGTIINEFGVKAFDFTYDGKKVKLQNVLTPINKWYIRKVLRKDMCFFLSYFKTEQNVEKDKRSLIFSTDGSILLTNKYHITYLFNPLNDKQ